MSTGNDNLVVTRCEIAFNGVDAFAHNLYLGGGNVTVQFCWVHDATTGQNIKSRAHYNTILCNYVSGSNEGEIGLVDDSVHTTTTNSNAYVFGNIIVSSAIRTGNNQKFVDFGQDSGNAHTGTMTFVNNTCVAGASTIQFLWATAADGNIIAYNNLFYGSNTIVGTATGTITGNTNWLPTTATVPGGFSSSVTGTNPLFTNPGARDYTLQPSSSAMNTGLNNAANITHIDGGGNTVNALTPMAYLMDLGVQSRSSYPFMNLGAF
jgi:hypothetical protein